MQTPQPDMRVSWKIHREILLLLGWGRAILMQLGHPLVAAGVAHHTSFLNEPKGRIKRLSLTVHAMLALTFGTAEEVSQAARKINGLHDHIRGQIPSSVGTFPGGTIYSAHDPALLCWVHVTLVDSFLYTYEFYLGTLSQEEKERYCAEAAEIEPLLGIPPGTLPRSTDEVRRYMDAMLESGKVVVGETAREIAREIVYPTQPLSLRLTACMVRLPTLGLLPSRFRSAYGFPWGPGPDALLRCSAWLIRHLLPLLPSAVRHWRQYRIALRRPTGEAVVTGESMPKK